MFRQFESTIDNFGNAQVDVRHNSTATEWDIYQISVTCGAMGAPCIVQLVVNGAFLCATPQGSLDTATGPPDVILNATDLLSGLWSNGVAGDTVVMNIWYNENPVGTTYSSAH